MRTKPYTLAGLIAILATAPLSIAKAGSLDEPFVQIGAPFTEAWIRNSRSDAIANGVAKMPRYIREKLNGYFENRIINKVRYHVDWSAAFDKGHAAAALVDVIVFDYDDDAENNYELWAHELAHIEQYECWGLRRFAIKYTRNSGHVEGQADEVAADFKESKRYGRQRHRYLCTDDQERCLKHYRGELSCDSTGASTKNKNLMKEGGGHFGGLGSGG